MRTLTLIAVVLLLAGAAHAETLEYPITTSSLSSVTHDGRILDSFTVVLPVGLTDTDLLEASLKLLVSPDPPPGAKVVQVEAAAWVGGDPLVPNGREGYSSEIAIDRGEEATVFLDLTAGLTDRLAAGSMQIEIVVGQISSDALPGGDVIPADADQGLWGTLRLHVK